MLALAYLTFVATVFCWQFRLAIIGKRTKGKAILAFASFSIGPIILYGAAFIALVGLEELNGATIIGEGYARTLPLVIVAGVGVVLLATLVFSLLILAMKRKDGK